ncbi:MAG TPA: transcription termination/antitermination protein NusA [Candidatus Jacksonbacteria bacterium]|nr:MAG: NusA antitermination factor [Parcubacteria group bacterium GW2011_GWC2_44_22]HBH46972.1 transcription termination/antitermination protein NusA [Candidatus Jacksonbacteria bacterium]HCC50532.1 transcription termination/antitermination protein NusA [Candidatus Jacksonbacteria bacterium]HCE49462.1 transcription termination/antitermination protein NusA [Candidatus Jacksonbacteria bacterium]HCR15213.1 transcription termination/antitermination protein NusA [Candidatus Jacksonbacteria bacteriu
MFCSYLLIIMTPDLYNVIKQICEEKQIPEEAVVATVELALAAAYRKDFADKLQNISVVLEPKGGQFKVYDIKEVVADVSPELLEEAYKLARQKKKAALFMPDGQIIEKEESTNEPVDLNDDKKLIEDGKVLLKFNPRTQITVSEARKVDAALQVGDQYKADLEVPHDFGRMAAQTAKQVIIQRIREAERETIFKEYKSKENKMMSGLVQRTEGSVVMVDIGRVNAILPYREQIPGDHYHIGQRIKVLLLSVEMTPKGPEIIVSRAHRDLVRALFELEVPEIESGTVELKSVAREAGSRSKISVVAHEENIDPIGSCVGQRGARVNAVIDELSGEKIDIIEWNEVPEKYIAASLSPAKVGSVEILDAATRQARVTVKSEQQSLAIGKGGQNVRLAAKLTGWKIDIVQFETGEKIAEVEADVEGGQKAEGEVAAEEIKKDEEQKNEAKPKAKKKKKTGTAKKDKVVKVVKDESIDQEPVAETEIIPEVEVVTSPDEDQT